MNNRLKGLKQDYNVLSKGEYASIIFGSIVGLVMLEISNSLGKISYQDNWISAVLGVIYPLYMVSISIYLSKKYPQDNILILSKKCFGNILGGIFNFIFLFYFFALLLLTVNEYSYMMKNFVVRFLTLLEIVVSVVMISAYVASNGIKVIGRMCKITFFLTIIFVMSPVSALRTGRIINIYPIFQSGGKLIAKGALNSVLAYSGIEVVFLIYPMLKDKNEYIKNSILPVLFTSIIYMWVSFIAVYYLGIDVVVKSNWPFLLVTESVTVKVINNYKYIFLFIWSLIIFKSIAIFYYASAYIVKSFINNLDIKKIVFFIYPVCVIISVKYGQRISINDYVGTIIKICIIFNILYVTLIFVIVVIRTNRK